MTEEEYARWEALVLSRERYQSDEEYRLNVLRWIRHMEPTCEQIRRKLADPYLVEQHQYLQECLDSYLAWQERLMKRFMTLCGVSSPTPAPSPAHPSRDSAMSLCPVRIV